MVALKRVSFNLYLDAPNKAIPKDDLESFEEILPNNHDLLTARIPPFGRKQRLDDWVSVGEWVKFVTCGGATPVFRVVMYKHVGGESQWFIFDVC